MDSNGGQKKINVGVISLSRLSVVASFISEFEKKSHNNATFNPSFIQLSAEDLDNPQYKMKIQVEALVLLHSIVEGRFSVTDVPDARYNKLLPRLADLIGSKGVGVIAHSMPNFNDVTKGVQMKLFQAKQHTTFNSSGCVILCGKLAEMSADEWNRLINFLAQAPDQRKPQPSDADENPISKGNLETQKSSSELSPKKKHLQADSDSPRKQIKADKLKFVIITSEGDSSSVDVIKRDIFSKAFCSMTIVTCTLKDWESSCEDAHALALLLQEKDLVDLCKEIPKEKRTNVSIFQPLRSRDSTEGREQYKVFEYEVTGDSTSNSSINFSKTTMDHVVSWLKDCYKNRSESHESQESVIT